MYLSNMSDKIEQLKLRRDELVGELNHWKAHEAVNNMGKWAKQVRIDSITEKLQKVQRKLELLGIEYLYEEKQNSINEQL